jgi:transcriptional repressor NF-X1
MELNPSTSTLRDPPTLGSSTARESTSGPRSGHAGRGRGRRPKDRSDFSVAGPIGGTNQGNSRSNRTGKKPPASQGDGRPQSNGANTNGLSTSNTPADSSTNKPSSRPKSKGRGQKFGATLTENVDAQHDNKSQHQRSTHRPKLAADADLTTSLIYGLSYPPYADCPICFNAIHPAQPTWSCSPPAEQCCWTTFHRKCIKPWAEKSVKELEEAWAARGERGKKGLWRCPGCQTKRQAIPGAYTCFCGSTTSPTLSRLHTPHSCGNPCSRKRDCSHSCPLACHPGPCPPCKVTLTQSCLCGNRQDLVKCGEGSRSTELTCDKICGAALPCGHWCPEGCHKNPCPPCRKIVPQRCVCGKVESQVVCGEKEDEIRCSHSCDKFFPCDTHKCSESCHSHPSFLRCPFHPDLVSRCPCGQHPMQPSSRDFFISPNDKDIILPRINCTDPIPTCTSTCNKPLPPSLCSSDIPHTCQMKCHLGPCALPCMNKITVPCRCGSISKTILCSDLALGDNGDGPGTSSMGELLCNKPCPAMRYCGKHTCNRVCCPLASLGKVKGKGKSRKIGAALGSDVDALDLDPGGLHVCDLDCGKLLSCGLHKCEARDHTGSCGPCLRSTFEEVICDCGMTTLEPPVPCGTILQCPYPCTRPPPPCGHPRCVCICRYLTISY